ncbi:hypothetical protein D9758_002724 [Tetrapyrgos nigripes]|uniref:Uncharacterized protein n=1 Tax=Tetrapyrgos nigripes TaxID=182062 RepID=A0A8H5GQY1_9AGAR|nr:hypothetical protein D9758_002724 [Tetrapyrgos nigripes]
MSISTFSPKRTILMKTGGPACAPPKVARMVTTNRTDDNIARTKKKILGIGTEPLMARGGGGGVVLVWSTGLGGTCGPGSAGLDREGVEGVC